MRDRTKAMRESRLESPHWTSEGEYICPCCGKIVDPGELPIVLTDEHYICDKCYAEIYGEDEE